MPPDGRRTLHSSQSTSGDLFVQAGQDLGAGCLWRHLGRWGGPAGLLFLPPEQSCSRRAAAQPRAALPSTHRVHTGRCACGLPQGWGGVGGASRRSATLQPRGSHRRGDLRTVPSAHRRMQGTLEVAEGQNETAFLPLSSCTRRLFLCHNYVFSVVWEKKNNLANKKVMLKSLH